MFKQRLLTTLILAPLVLMTIYYASQAVFISLVWLLLLACGIEWLQLIPVQKWPFKLVFILLLLVIAGLIQYGFHAWLWVSLVLWGLITIALLTFPASQRIWGYAIVVAMVGLFILPLFAQSMISIHNKEEGEVWVIYLLLFTWAADMGAYLIGKRWGRHKLIPWVSPGKTIEGCFAAFALSMLIAVGGYYYFQPSASGRWFALAVCTLIISILGDLLISLFKRRAQLKDTGRLLPGHGGVLDRLDSLIAAAPLFYGGLCFLAFG